MRDKQMVELLDRVAKLEAEVEQLKAGRRCGDGLIGLFGIQKNNPMFPEVIAEIEKERAADRKRLGLKPVKKQPARRNATKKKK